MKKSYSSTPKLISKKRSGSFIKPKKTNAFLTPSFIQPKLTIAQANDSYEKQADYIANKIVNKPEGRSTHDIHKNSFSIQAKCKSCKEDEHIQKKSLTANILPFIQPSGSNLNTKNHTSSSFENKLNNSKGEGVKMSSTTQNYMDDRFGFDFNNVRIHTNANAIQMNKEIGAHAFTNGNNIYFNQGKYDPNSTSGRVLLAHELTHTIQQNTSKNIIQRSPMDDCIAELGGDTRYRDAGIPTQEELENYRQQCERRGIYNNQSNPIIPVRDFVSYVEEVENTYPNDSNQEIITRIRQMYYAGIAFDQLILDAPIIEAETQNHPERLRGLYRNEMSSEAYGHLTANADENNVRDNPSPYILLDNREQLDLGHLLLGLDALIHPRTGLPFSTYSVPNIDPASWVADLGIAAVWMQYHEDRGGQHIDVPRNMPSANFDQYYTMSAPEEDLLGDVDSFGLYAIYQQNTNLKLSQILHTQYLGSNPNVNRRWEMFCQTNGLIYTRTGNTIQWSPESIRNYIIRINRFNDLYDAGTFGTVGAVISPGTPSRGSWRYTRPALRRFLRFVQRNLINELLSN